MQCQGNCNGLGVNMPWKGTKKGCDRLGDREVGDSFLEHWSWNQFLKMSRNLPHRNSGQRHSRTRSQYEENVEKHDSNPIIVNYHQLIIFVYKKTDDNQNPQYEADQNSTFIISTAPLWHSLKRRPSIIWPLPNALLFRDCHVPSADTYCTVLLHISQMSHSINS